MPAPSFAKAPAELVKRFDELAAVVPAVTLPAKTPQSKS